MRFRNDESGQMLVLTAVCMTVLMGFLALAVDVGTLFRAKRAVQIAADAGAIAGALQEQYGGTPSPACGGGVSAIRCAAQNAVVANGIPASDLISVNTNPSDGYHKGTGYVEAVLSVPNPTFFFSAFKGTKTSFNVTARAVAGMTPSTACIYVLDPTDADALTVDGNVTAPRCGIQVNSNSGDAACNEGATITAPFVHIVGGQNAGGGCQTTTSTQVVTGVAPSGDPLNNLNGVNPATYCSPLNTLNITGGGPPTVNNGTRIPASTVNIAGVMVTISCFSNLNITLSRVTLGGGGGNQVFVFLNGLQLLGNVRINGTMEVAGGVLNGAGGNLTVAAPANAGDLFNGIAVFQPSTDATPCNARNPRPCLILALTGGTTGLIYAPGSTVSIQGNGGVGGIVAYQVDVTGPLTLSGNYNIANPGTSPLNKVELVE